VSVFSIEKIRKIAANNQIYECGVDYYSRHLVKELFYDPATHCVKALVADDKKYRVLVELGEEQSIHTFFCTCPTFFDYHGACKHVVAALLEFSARKKPSLQLTSPKNNSNPAIISKEDAGLAISRSLITALLNRTRQPIENQIKLRVTLDQVLNKTSLPYLKLQIGLTRLYPVKNLRELIEAVALQKELYFGQTFTFCPKLHTFHPQDQPLIDFLLELYYDERLGWSHRSDFDPSQYKLKPSQLRRFLSFAGEMPQAFWRKDAFETPQRIIVSQTNPPLTLQVGQGPQHVEIRLKGTELLLFLTPAKDTIMADNRFYLLTPRAVRILTEFWEAFATRPNHNLPLADQVAAAFFTQLEPMVKEFCQLKIAPEVESRMHSAPLIVVLWLDKAQNDILLKLRFRYGAIEVDPFAEAPAAPQGQLLLRDYPAETAFLQRLAATGFQRKAEGWILLGEMPVYHFLRDILPQLKATCQIHHSEEFANLKIRRSLRLNGAIRLNETADRLEIAFDHLGLAYQELAAFEEAVREKKKCYRMKNGDFIDLTGSEIQKFGKLLEQLRFDGAEIEKNVIIIPKYRALYLSQMIRTHGLGNFELNTALTQLIQTVNIPQKLETTLPANLDRILRPYQKTGFKWLKTLSTSGFGGILADDMGLGKTLQIIAWVQCEYSRSLLPSLVVAPTSLVYNWREEMAKFAPELSVLVLCGAREERLELLQNANRYAMVITSYPLIRRDIETVREIKFAGCILDEAQHIKNPASFNAQTVKQIHARHHFALTGTPIENSLSDLWSIFDFIMPGYLYSQRKFQTRFAIPIARRNDSKAASDLEKHIRPFILRRLKKEVLAELPEKIETKICCEMTEEQQQIYRDYLAKARYKLRTELDNHDLANSQMKILALLIRLRQICCHPGLFINGFSGGSGKLELLLELIRDSCLGGHRILVFSQFVKMLDLIAAQLHIEAIPYFRIDGHTPPERRVKLVNDFNTGAVEIFLISLKAGGTGLNLTGADTVIHYDPWWNPAVENQATDRAHRIGQQNVVQVFKLVTKGTIEERVFALQQKKQELIADVINPGENWLGKMTLQEIRELFAE
jgi:hypothetical protein